MRGKVKVTDPAACVHCHVCRQHCLFLKKYELDIGDTEKLKELSYHCFLCGRCSEVCPVGIDGREIILQMRRERVRCSKGRLDEKGYGILLKEKQDYIFQNYRKAAKKSVLFPGCSFSAYYPETTRYLAELYREKTGGGIVFDCCGKPVAELGLEEQERKIIGRIERRLEENGVEEVVALCPNCYTFLKPRLDVKVVSIYRKLRELGIGRMLEGRLSVFLPCPDRENGELLGDIRAFLEEEPDTVSRVQCCGLGGCAWKKEKELAAEMAGSAGAVKKPAAESVRDMGTGKREPVYTYCASCAGNFARNGRETRHMLLEILGSTERPDTGSSVKNRIKEKYWGEKDEQKK